MGAQPTPPQRPEALHGMHMDFTKAVAIFIAGVLASSMVDALLLVSPRTQASIKAVCLRVYKSPWGHGLGDQRLNGLLLPMGQHVDDHLTTPLHHPKDRGPLLLPCATAPLAFASVSTPFASLVLSHRR